MFKNESAEKAIHKATFQATWFASVEDPTQLTLNETRVSTGHLTADAVWDVVGRATCAALEEARG